jgi:MYXO-CTERM domain-containing protein
MEVEGTILPGSVSTAGPDHAAPTAPVILDHFGAGNPNEYFGCTTNRVELLSITPSTDDQTPAADLRYSVSRQLSPGTLERAYAELSLFDGGLLALPYGLQGLPGTYVVQARDWAGNISAPSNPEPIDIGPGCDCGGQTTGHGPVSMLGLLGALLLWVRSKRARSGSA